MPIKSLFVMLLTIAAGGCAGMPDRHDDGQARETATVGPAKSAISRLPSDSTDHESVQPVATLDLKPVVDPGEPEFDDSSTVQLISAEEEVVRPLSLATVVASVRQSYPLLEAAVLNRKIASGAHQAAHGEFDTKLKGASENGFLGSYRTYRQNLGIDQPTMWGGSVFGGYRIGRGDFQPWYLERLTDEAGEFKAGIQVPLMRNVGIDQRRADLWKTSLGQQLAEPQIARLQIDFVRDASFAFWEWVAAGRRVQVADGLLSLARDRNEGIRIKVEVGDTDPPVLQDNQRLIVSRQAKLIDEQRKQRQTAVKLSLFLRDAVGQPVIPAKEQRPDFPKPHRADADQESQNIQLALAQRPEFSVLDLQRRQFEIDYQQACNESRPDLRSSVLGAKDVGKHASNKRDKREFELEAALTLEVPMQRNKARGRILVTEGKLAQLAAKRRMATDKVTSEVQVAIAGIQAAVQKVALAHEAVELATRMATIEQRRFELGESDLLAVNLREQQAAEARNLEIDALLEYYLSVAERDAAVGNN